MGNRSVIFQKKRVGLEKWNKADTEYREKKVVAALTPAVNHCWCDLLGISSKDSNRFLEITRGPFRFVNNHRNPQRSPKIPESQNLDIVVY